MVKTFGEFEFDDQRRTLTRAGRRLRVSGQAFDLLSLLLERPGEVITREEIQSRLWPGEHVEFDHSLDVVISRLRSLLGERSANARYIETVPRKGYRFIAAVGSRSDVVPRSDLRRWMRRLGIGAAIAILAAAVAFFIAHTRYDRFVPGHPPAAPSGKR